MSRRTPPTLEEVARVAGLSRATVSRVINQSPRVSEEARRAVEAAIERLGYSPNRAARSLVTGTTDSVGLVVAESEARVFSEPFFAALIRGVAATLSDQSRQLVLIMSRTPEEGGRVERYLAAGHVDGVLLVSAHASDPLIAHLDRLGVPVVLAGRPLASVKAPYVDADNVGGARDAVWHLISKGRRQIATIAGPQDMSAGVDRLVGYQTALAEAGAVVDPSLVVIGDFGAESGSEAMQRLLAARPDLDGVFAASDPMAAGAMAALSEAGRRIPDDVSVVGFDDSVIAETANPPLTSVRQPVEAIGREMVDILSRLIEDPGAAAEPVVLPTEVIVRRSA